jgi:hypothetical protein
MGHFIVSACRYPRSGRDEVGNLYTTVSVRSLAHWYTFWIAGYSLFWESASVPFLLFLRVHPDPIAFQGSRLVLNLRSAGRQGMGSTYEISRDVEFQKNHVTRMAGSGVSGIFNMETTESESGVSEVRT